MEWTNLWAPWRIQYIRGLTDDETDQPADAGDDGAEPVSFLREAFEKPDEDRDRLVLHREDAGLILMNRYPYTGGHLMVAPGQEVADLGDIPAAQRARIMEMVVLAERLIQTVLNPQGINIGINIGRSAGAGLPNHVHIHPVPRWGGDTNFMHVVGNVRVIPQALEELYDEMKAALPKVVEELK